MAMECWPSGSKRPGILVERDSPWTSESSRPAVAHAGQLHRRHDGACRLLAGLFQLDSIATDPALGSTIFMKWICRTRSRRLSGKWVIHWNPRLPAGERYKRPPVHGTAANIQRTHGTFARVLLAQGKVGFRSLQIGGP